MGACSHKKKTFRISTLNEMINYKHLVTNDHPFGIAVRILFSLPWNTAGVHMKK